MSSKNKSINSGQFRIVSSFNIGGCSDKAGDSAHHIYDNQGDIYDNQGGSNSVYKSTFDSYNNNYTSQGCYTKSSYLKYAKK